jgi:hypothetical protein
MNASMSYQSRHIVTSGKLGGTATGMAYLIS